MGVLFGMVLWEVDVPYSAMIVLTWVGWLLVIVFNDAFWYDESVEKK